MNSLMINNAPMVDNGHFGDEDVAVLVSIVVLRKGGAGTVGWPGCRAYPSLLSVRT